MDTSDTFYRMCFEAFPEDRDRGTVFKAQDQLQEMIERKNNEGRARVLELTERFSGFCATNTISHFASMEQLWLAFVMKDKYNKTWDGEGWA